LFLICRKNLAEATFKLQKLKALQYYDVETEVHILLGEVEVNMLRGDAEEVFLLFLFSLTIPGSHAFAFKFSKTE
jgi:hypothetical protein